MARPLVHHLDIERPRDFRQLALRPELGELRLVVGVGEQRIFLRKASGLIRSASPLDTFIFNIGLVSVGLGVGTIMFYGPAYYAGGDLLWSCVIAGVAMAFIAFGMITWTLTLPRSGGIYVFGSRSLPPFLALTLSLVEITAWLFYCAIAAFWIIKLGVGPALAMIGYVSGSEWAANASVVVTEPWPLFLIGSAILILSGAIIAGGMKRYLLSQKIVFAAAIVGSIILIVVLLSGSREEFIAAFNATMGPVLDVENAYDAVIASAKEGGWGYEGRSWNQTWLVSNWAFLPLIGAAFSIAIGGEIKSVERSQTWGMLGAVVGTVVIWLVTIWLADEVFGYDFLGAAVYNLLSGTGVTTPTDPSITLLAGILTGSWVVTVLVGLGLVFWMWMWIPGMHTFAVRAMVAWAFDRIAPAFLGQVSATRHTPTAAIWVSVAITVVFMALFVFTAYFQTIVILIEAAILAWSIVLLAGVFFPYRRPDIYEKSPIAARKVLGLPMMTVACALGFAAAQFYFWTLFFDDVAAGHKPEQLVIVGGVFLAGVIFYFVMKELRRTQGVDVTLAFKEIPIE
ncbi:MAG: APC family permease [Alphaproteobacteria bacterium]